MSNEPDQIRTNTLNQIEQTEKLYKLAFVAAALVEGAFFVAFFLLADFSNRVHVLILLSVVALYSIIGAGLMALGSHMSRNTLRVVRAIEMINKP
jgi:hypothetical protein